MRHLAILVAIACCAASAGAASRADRAFERLAARYLDQGLVFSPVGATLQGDHRFDARLDEVSAGARAAQSKFTRELLDALAKIDRDKLSRANQVDAALLEHDLQSTLWQLEALREWERNPLFYTGTAGSAIFGLVAREYAPLPTRLAAVASRLEQLPRFLEQVRATLVASRVPRIHAEVAVQQNRGVLSLLDEMVAPALPQLDPALRDRLEKAMAAARTAVEAQQQWLEKTLLPAAAGDFRVGEEVFDRKLAFSLHTPLTRADIGHRALAEFTRVRLEMYDVAKAIYLKEYPNTEFPAQPDEAYRQAITRAALEVACRQLPDRDRIVETATGYLADATAFVKEHDLVTVPPDPVEVVVMPEFQRGVAVAYCDSPGPLDRGQKTFFSVAPLPKEWTEEQARSFLREYNVFSLRNLTIHEAMPGHFLQIALSNRYPSTLRALLSSGPFVEGWAVYTEKLMADTGFVGGDPLMRLIQLKWYLRAVTNAILDQAIHCGGMSEQEAMKLMIEGAFQEEREAAGKWRRACLTSVQLSTYFVGYQEHADLRAEVEQAWGSSFSLKRYHDTLLSFGSPPVQFVRALMLDQPIPR